MERIESFIIKSGEAEFSFNNYLPLTGNINIPDRLVRVDLYGAFSMISAVNSGAFEVYLTAGAWKYEGAANIKWQGSSSLAFPEKNLRLDLDKKIRFGSWAETDSFDIKVNWTDFSQSKNVGAAKWLHKVAMSKRAHERYPWWPKIIPTATGGINPSTAMAAFQDTGARGVIDGFAVEIYINDQFYGLGTWNLKKDRENMNMVKNNQNHIWLDWDNFQWAATPVWTGMEIRNPSGFDALVEPPAGAVKNSISRVVSWVNNASNAEFTNNLADYFYTENLCEYFIFMNLMWAGDNNSRNMQMATWANSHWAIIWYDMDGIFGTGGGISGLTLPPAGFFPINTLGTKLKTNFWPQIKAKYKSLRDAGLISPQTLEGCIREVYDKFSIADFGRDLARWPELTGNNYSHMWGISPYQIISWYTTRLSLCDTLFEYN